ncbi:MAG TPA: ABC transporter permease [Devosiaceae bacterium]|jgi:peptide/nickel transport system permease protein
MTVADETAIEMVAPVERRRRPVIAAALEFAESPLAVFGLVLFVALSLAAILAPWISPQNPYDLMSLSLWDNYLPPGSTGADGQYYILGTDAQGRDMLSAILYGLRTSLFIACLATFLAFVLGVTVGLIAAFVRGPVESILMRIVDIQLSFPPMLIGLMLLAILGAGIDKIIIAVVAVAFASYTRTCRAIAGVELAKDYVQSAQCLVLPTRRILFRHVLPNCMPPLLVMASVQIGSVIGLEATLSFLGVGVPLTEPSLGSLISIGFGYLMSGQYWITFFPGVALFLAILSINLVGDRLRDVMNPRLKR